MTLCFVLITGPIGMILNFSFVVLTLTNSVLRKGYSWFFCGLTSLNFIYCLNNSTTQVVVLIMDVGDDSAFCSVVSVLITSTAIGSVCMQSLISIQRFVGLVHANKQTVIFSPRNNFILTCFITVFSLGLTVISWKMGDMGRIGQTICGPNMSDMPTLHVAFLVAPLIISYAICAICGYKIKRLLINHESNMRHNEVGSVLLRDAQQIVRLITIELVVPITLEAPFLLCGLLRTKIYIDPMLIAISVCLFLTHAVVDPIIIVLVMRPYRNVLKKKFRINQRQVEPTTMIFTTSFRK